MCDKILNVPVDAWVRPISNMTVGVNPCGEINRQNPDDRKYFFIMNNDKSLVLDVKDDIDRPGASLIVWPRKSCRTDNQVWYYETSTRSIHTKFNDFCLTVKGRVLEVRAYGHHATQHWQIPSEGDDWTGALQSEMQANNKTLVIAADKTKTGSFTFVNVADACDEDKYQQWYLVFPRYFLLRSLSKPTYVLEIVGDQVIRTKYFSVRYKHEENKDSRLWYIAEDEAVCCVKDDIALDIHGDEVKVKPWCSANKKFIWSEEKFIEWSNRGRVLEVKLSALHPSVTVARKAEHSDNIAQHWRREFVLFDRKEIVTHGDRSKVTRQRQQAVQTQIVSKPT